MFLNYLKIAWRNLKRKPIFSVINIAGLAIGLAACIMIGLWVQHELSYDRFQKNSGRIYRVINHITYAGKVSTANANPIPLAPALTEHYSEVKKAVRVSPARSRIIKANGQLVNQDGYVVADPGFFDLFSFALLKGNKQNLLNRPGSVVLTKRTALKYFPNQKAVGQTLQLGGNLKTVTGVVADPPANSSLQFSVVETSREGGTNWRGRNKNWASNPVATYVLLNDGANTHRLQSNISQFVNKRLRTDQVKSYSVSMYLQSLTDIHLQRGVPYQIMAIPGIPHATGSVTYVWLFTALALFILLLASINYVNLATARSSERAREVGIRKTLGAGRWGLARQFLGEAALTCLVSLIFALVIAQLVLPAFNSTAGVHLSLGQLWGFIPMAVLTGLMILLILGSSWYPALLLSGFSPSSVFKSDEKSSGGINLRKGLVIFQFTVAVVLIIATVMVYRQLNYMQSAALGFDKAQVVVVKDVVKARRQAKSRTSYASQLHSLRSELQKLPGVKNATLAYTVPSQRLLIKAFQRSGSNSAETHQMQYTLGDKNYLNTLDIPLITGRNFSSLRQDSASVILNEAAAKTLFRNQKAVGKYISIAPSGRKLKVVGVMKNFHFRSLQHQVEPLIIRYNGGFARVQYMAVKLQGGRVQETLASVKQTWQKLIPDVPFNYSFLDRQVAAQYSAQQKTGRIFAGFTILAVIVACLGLFGLTAYAVRRRTKEIGVRKILGASVSSIVGLLSKDFLKLVIIGFAIAVPIGWYAMHRWLQGFAYKAKLSPWIFLLAGVLALVIALLTVSWQSIRAALANPVDSLKSE